MVDYQNQYKNIVFKKDLFSNSNIIYKIKSGLIPDKVLKEYNFLNSRVIKIYIPKNNTATNSTNFLICEGKNKYYLKKESIKKEDIKEKTHRFEQLKKINKNNSLVLPVKKKRKFFRLGNNIWSIYKFFDGGLFSGKKNELKIVTKSISKALLLFDNIRVKKKSFRYFTNDANNIVNNYKINSETFKKILNNKNNKNNKVLINYFFYQWTRLKKIKKKFNNLKKVFCHFDLHPHNIMIKNKKVKIIDLASIKYMPLEIAIAFSGLKLCRQTIYKKKTKNFSSIGLDFIKSLDTNFKKNLNKKIYVSDLANIEIMRRICIILKYNLNGDKSLNYILPTLMSNLIESDIIFNGSKF